MPGSLRSSCILILACVILLLSACDDDGPTGPPNTGPSVENSGYYFKGRFDGRWKVYQESEGYENHINGKGAEIDKDKDGVADGYMLQRGSILKRDAADTLFDHLEIIWHMEFADASASAEEIRAYFTPGKVAMYDGIQRYSGPQVRWLDNSTGTVREWRSAWPQGRSDQNASRFEVLGSETAIHPATGGEMLKVSGRFNCTLYSQNGERKELRGAQFQCFFYDEN